LVTAFFKQAINNNGFTDKVVMDKSGANYAGLANINLLLGNKGELSQNLPRNATEPFSDTWTGRGRKPKWVEALC
jgi:DNA-binding protein H-NS